MKLSKAIRIATFAGSAALLAPAAHAVGPVFDGWTVNNGTVDVTCGSCSTVVSGDGFAQVEHVLNGETYLQTIITEMGETSAGTIVDVNGAVTTAGTLGADGVTYSDESFILLGGNQKGIKAKQSMNDVASNFSGSTSLNLGWADDGSNNSVEVTQSFSDTGTAVQGDSFQSSFSLSLDTVTDAQTGVRSTVGRSLSIDQTAELGNGTDPNDTSIQRYVAEQRQGTLQNMIAGSITLGGVTVDVVDAADSVMMTWLGQKIQIDPAVATSIDTFGFQSFVNATTRDLNSDVDPDNNRYVDPNAATLVQAPHEASVYSSETTSFTAANTPFVWDAYFSTAPTLPAVSQ